MAEPASFPTPPRLQIVPFGVWTKLQHFDAWARGLTMPAAVAQLNDDGSVAFDGPVALRAERPPEVPRG
jgi:hypothetical protein